MRLRQLKFPIAVLKPNSLMGGKNAGLSRPSSFNEKVASYYLKGGYDDALLYDSDGNEFSVRSIEFGKVSPLARVKELLHWTSGGSDDLVRVDMELEHLRTLSFDQFCSELREIALDHPTWWKRHSERAEIEAMFTNAKTFSEAIEDIGVLDPPGKERLPGKSTKIVDMRK